MSHWQRLIANVASKPNSPMPTSPSENHITRRTALRLASAPTVAFTHFPLGKGVTYRPLNADAVLARLTTLNLRATFSGHGHGLNEQRLDRAHLIVNRCCARIRGNRDGSPLKGWWVCKATADGTLTHRFASLPVEQTAAP